MTHQLYLEINGRWVLVPCSIMILEVDPTICEVTFRTGTIMYFPKVEVDKLSQMASTFQNSPKTPYQYLPPQPVAVPQPVAQPV